MPYTKIVATSVDIFLFSMGPVGGTLGSFLGSLKNVKLKEEVGEIRSDGICDAWEDNEKGKGKWSIDCGNKATATAISLRAGDMLTVQIKSGIPTGGVYPLTRTGTVMVASREDDLGSDSESQSVNLTLKGKGALASTI